MTQYPSKEPSIFRAGTTVAWTKDDFAQYPYADGWTIAKYTINGNGGTKEITGSHSSGQWLFSLNAAVNTLAKGIYRLYGYVQNAGGDVQTVYDDVLEVQQSLVTASATDQRLFWQKVLDALQATMLKKANMVQQAMTEPLTGKSIQYLPLKELQAAISNAEFELDKLKNNGRMRNIYPEFVQTS